jgi:hypothetical protein
VISATIGMIREQSRKEIPMGLILLILVVLLLVGALPHWGYSRNWGYFPSGGLGLVLLILLVLLLLGFLPYRF